MPQTRAQMRASKTPSRSAPERPSPPETPSDPVGPSIAVDTQSALPRSLKGIKRAKLTINDNGELTLREDQNHEDSYATPAASTKKRKARPPPVAAASSSHVLEIAETNADPSLEYAPEDSEYGDETDDLEFAIDHETDDDGIDEWEASLENPGATETINVKGKGKAPARRLVDAKHQSARGTRRRKAPVDAKPRSTQSTAAPRLEATSNSPSTETPIDAEHRCSSTRDDFKQPFNRNANRRRAPLLLDSRRLQTALHQKRQSTQSTTAPRLETTSNSPSSETPIDAEHHCSSTRDDFKQPFNRNASRRRAPDEAKPQSTQSPSRRRAPDEAKHQMKQSTSRRKALLLLCLGRLRQLFSRNTGRRN
ncbi:hypothetical protein QIS74_10152 [Colletotrichum tabaci]|uniref:Uncharacterized protein n=1 Tax=Colletotrichum tabaci TaxID=1209068 RepID=A0AAV9T2N3_9PEZI